MEILIEAAKLIIDEDNASTQMLCRYLKDEKGDLILFNRAAAIMEKLEKAGIVSQFYGNKPREILITDIKQVEQLIKNNQNG